MSLAVATTVEQPQIQQYSQRTLPQPNTPTPKPTQDVQQGLSGPPSTPGTFRHPRLDEIVKRRNATQFTDRNIQTVGINAIMLVATFVVPLTYLEYLVDAANRFLDCQTIHLSSSPVLIAVRLLLIVNIALSLRPLTPLASSDNLDDIPLTPSQRKLLGLPRSSQPAAESGPISAVGNAAGYITPPRYRRSSPSPALSSSSGNNGSARSDSAQYGGSPLSASRHTLGYSPTPTGGSPASNKRNPAILSSVNAANSPLLNRVLNKSTSNNNISLASRGEESNDFSESAQQFSTTNRMGLRKSMNGPQTQQIQSVPGTPSPRGRQKVKLEPGVNYKWLYDKGLKADGSPGGAGNFS